MESHTKRLGVKYIYISKKIIIKSKIIRLGFHQYIRHK